MKIMNKDKMVNFLKQVSFVGAIIFAATFLQFYWAMGELSERMSSACLDCWFVEDAFFMSLITSVFLALIFRLLLSKLNLVFRVIIQLLLLISIWFYWDYTIFVERESSWSTYLFNEEIHYVVTLSVLPILVMSFAAIFLINYKSFIKNLFKN